MAIQPFIMPLHSYIKGHLNNKPAVTRFASIMDKFPVGQKCFQKIRYQHICWIYDTCVLRHPSMGQPDAQKLCFSFEIRLWQNYEKVWFILTKGWAMSDENVNPIWNFAPHFLYGITTSLHEGPITKLWCPGKEKIQCFRVCHRRLRF